MISFPESPTHISAGQIPPLWASWTRIVSVYGKVIDVINFSGLSLAKLHSQAVDFAKTGVPARMDRDLQPRRWPHFMEKKRRPDQIYHSRKVLGQLYDLIQNKDFTPSLDKAFDKDILSAYKVSDTMAVAALRLKMEYDSVIKSTMAQHGIKTEFEVFSAFVLSHNQEKKDYTFAEELGMLAFQIKDRFRDLCAQAAGGKDDTTLRPFVAAMYKVTADQIAAYLDNKTTVEGWADDVPFISFPWIFDRHMNDIKRGVKHVPLSSFVGVPRDDMPELKPVVMLPLANTIGHLVKVSENARLDNSSPDSGTGYRIVPPTGPVHTGELLALFGDDPGVQAPSNANKSSTELKLEDNLQSPHPVSSTTFNRLPGLGDLHSLTRSSSADSNFSSTSTIPESTSSQSGGEGDIEAVEKGQETDTTEPASEAGDEQDEIEEVAVQQSRTARARLMAMSGMVL
jgi:hypothetical protein